MVRHVTIRRAAELTGYTEDAIRAKIERGVWREGALWRHAPDDRILIDLEGYDAWAAGLECAQLVPKQSRSTSAGRGSGVVSEFDSYRRKRTSRTAEAGSGE